MRVFNKRFIKNFWFGCVMKVTGVLPEVAPVMKLRGWMIKPCFEQCGNNLQITKDVRIFNTYNLSIGNDVFFSGGCWVLASDRVVIEDEVMLGPYSIVITGDHTIKDYSYRFGEAIRAPIHLKRGSWVCAHSVVTKGVTLGLGAVVAAGSVVTKDVPDFSVVGGVPAVIIDKNLK